jgi:hypothetical protein
MVDDALGKKVALMLFLLVFSLGLLLILGLPRFKAAWRTAETEGASPLRPSEPEEDPDVLRLPAARGEEQETNGDEAASIVRRES